MLIKFAYRNIKKRPLLNLIRISVLSIGLSGILGISLFLKNELNYDASHKNSDRIFRLTISSQAYFENNHFARLINSESLLALANEIPEVENFVRLIPLRDNLIVREEQNYSIDQAFTVDDTFFQFFDVDFLKGNKNRAFTMPGATVISESFAQKVFGNENPIGKVLSLPVGHFNSEEQLLTITGVYKDFNQGNHIHPNLLVMQAADKISGWAYAYLLLDKKSNLKAVSRKASHKFTRLFSAELNSDVKVTAHLMNIRDIHLKSNLLREIEPNSKMASIYIFLISGVILSFISLSNFTNLSIGMSGYLSKFLSINQVLGSSKKIIYRYFFVESVMIVLVAMVITMLACSSLNVLLVRNYQIHLLQGNELFALVIMLLFGLFGVLAGVQPVLNKIFKDETLSNILRRSHTLNRYKIMLIAQFTMVIVLLVNVNVITEQTRFALEKSMGATNNDVICIPAVHVEIQKSFNVFKSELLRFNEIISVSAMMDAPGGETNDMFSYELDGVPTQESNTNSVGVFACDYSFAEVFDLTFVAGENFSSLSYDEPEKGEYLINQTAMKYFGFKDPFRLIGKSFSLISPVENVTLPKGKIIGVLKDFHLSGLQTKVAPLVLFKRADNWLGNIVVRYKPSLKKEALAQMSKIWASLFPKYPLEYLDVNTLYKGVYKTEFIQRNLILIFAIISVFICVMGVVGLSLIVAQRRFKEIGIRKVNGATISEIVYLLNKDFLSIILLAFVIATPIAFFVAHKWLEGFAYKIDISWWMFANAGIITLFITMITVSFNSYSAAKQNSIKSIHMD